MSAKTFLLSLVALIFVGALAAHSTALAPFAWTTCDPIAGTAQCATVDSNGNLHVDAATGSALLSAIQAPPPLATSGGWTPAFKAALTTTVFSVKSSAGWLGKAQCDNPNATEVFLQMFDTASGSVTLGTTAPVDILSLQPGMNSGWTKDVQGVQYNTAIAVAATTTATGSTAPGAGVNCSFAYH